MTTIKRVVNVLAHAFVFYACHALSVPFGMPLLGSMFVAF